MKREDIELLRAGSLDHDVEASESELKSVVYTAISFLAAFVLLISGVVYVIL